MKPEHQPITYRNRPIGVVALVSIQFLIGIVHTVLGFWLLTASGQASSSGNLSLHNISIIYSLYTIIFALSTIAFTLGIWSGRRWGWLGTVSTGLFVIVANFLTLLDLPIIPGIPEFACFGEISYSVLVIMYLITADLRREFGIRFHG